MGLLMDSFIASALSFPNRSSNVTPRNIPFLDSESLRLCSSDFGYDNLLRTLAAFSIPYLSSIVLPLY